MVRNTLLALADGDSVALTGTLTPKVWLDKRGEARPALDMVAHAALTPYQVIRKRQVTKPGSSASRASGQSQTVATADDIANDLPWAG